MKVITGPALVCEACGKLILPGEKAVNLYQGTLVSIEDGVPNVEEEPAHDYFLCSIECVLRLAAFALCSGQVVERG